MTEFQVDRDYFRTHFPSQKLFGKTLSNQLRLAGFNAIFNYWDSIESFDSLEWLAYELATAWHETGGTMQPVREGFKKTDAAAFSHVTAYCKRKRISNYAARHSNGNSYYGRGYVQLTHATNYKKMGRSLNLGDQFYDQPDLVMEADIAAKILVDGMMDGLFRPKAGTLFNYFNGTNQLWYQARDLINGDKSKRPKWAKGKSIGTLVSDYGKAFRSALKFV